MSVWLTARELAGFPGMPSTEFRTREKLQKLGVPSRARAGRGGGVEFDCSRLPAQTRTALMIEKVTIVDPAIAANVEGDALVPAEPQRDVAQSRERPPSQSERAVADARLLLVNQVLSLEPLHGIKGAASLIALQLASGTATDLGAVARTANQRARDASVSTRTLQRWISTYRAQGWWGLLPAAPESLPVTEVGDDVAAVLALYHSKEPRFRNLSQAAQDVTKRLKQPVDSWKQLYARARRALPKLDKVDLIKARHSGSARAARLPFKRRDTTVLRPLDVWVCDGHTFKAKVRHPDHGAPFAPEVTAVIDAATRKICGWSVSLSENVIAVGDALRHAVGNNGVPAIIYSDNGAGQTAKQLDCPITGVIGRLGAEHRTGIPGNPQARGIIEKSWLSWLIPCAKQFASYQGKDVDAGTLRRVSAELAKEQRALKRAEHTGEVIRLSTKAPSWKQFIDAVGRAVDEYNNEHRHRSLPKHESGPHAGKHMTPAEAWDAQLDRELQFKLSALELRMLFMPAVLRTAKRGEVQFFSQIYYSADLMAVDGQQVRVHYDIHDPARVQIFDLRGEFVCEAGWNANRKAFFAQPVIEMARTKRVETRMKRLQGQMDLAQRELGGVGAASGTSLPAPGSVDVLVPHLDGGYEPALQVDEPAGGAAKAEAGRPFFDTPSERYEWLMGHRADWDTEDRAWLAQYAAGDEYESLAEYFDSRGIAWKDGEEGFRSAR
ncbi:Mu transposase C-terminal domain-containing protein [Ramlibacter sp.]|uniref:Mu transposase C-terminal domain-containing protein n=1 Tax=Ramlibacter sp. TaxID=1917967 RepID=UPI003D0E06C3